MGDEIGYKTRIYTDVQGLRQIKYTKDTEAAKKEIAQQFEAMFMQMVLRSMRDATKAFSSGLFSNSQMDLYQDMFDKQLSLMMSNSNLGFAKMVEKNIDQFSHSQTQPQSNAIQPKMNALASTKMAVVNTDIKSDRIDSAKINHDAPQNPNLNSTDSSERDPGRFASAEEFVKKLWSTAKAAASMIGASPEILLAQAALETNWGKNILSLHDNESSHNLFNIKAGLGWGHKTTTVNTIEQKDGVLIREKSKFRSYDSYKESFMDYINLLKNNGRYDEALNNAADPKQFIQAIHHAGYATDPNYSDKILKIFSSKMFQNIVAKIKNI